MADYRVDPEGVRAISVGVGALAHSGPLGSLPGADGCGHPPTVAVLETDGTEFSGAWRRAEQAVLDLGSAGVRAAEVYADADSHEVPSRGSFAGGVTER